jgi:hypothetical protein
MRGEGGMDSEQLLYDRLVNPSPMFSVFVPNEEKVKILSNKLLHEYLYLPDEYREPQKIQGLLQIYLSGIASIFYEFKDFGGVIGFINIIPEYKADIVFKFWDRKLWGPTFFRELKGLIEMIMDELRLIRLSAQSPDKKMEHFAHLCGFKTECSQKYGFKWGGRYYPLRLLAKTRVVHRKGD